MLRLTSRNERQSSGNCLRARSLGWRIRAARCLGWACFTPVLVCLLACVQSGSGGLIKKDGSFKVLELIEPKKKLTFEIAGKAGKKVAFSVKPAVDAKLTIDVYERRTKVASTSGLKKEFKVTWTPRTNAPCIVKVTSMDNLANACMISFGPATPPLIDGKYLVKKTMRLPRGKFVFVEVPMKAGKTYTINVRQPKGSQVDPYIYLYTPNNKLLESDDDGGGYPHSRITRKIYQTGKHRVKIRDFGNNDTGNFLITVEPLGGK